MTKLKKLMLAFLTAIIVLVCLPTPTFRPMLTPLATEPEKLEQENGLIPDIWQLTLDFAKIYGVDEGLALCVLNCESSGNPNAENGIHAGAWQYRLDTWQRIRKAQGRDIKDMRWCPVESTKTTMWAFANGYAGEWECYWKCL